MNALEKENYSIFSLEIDSAETVKPEGNSALHKTFLTNK